MITRIADSKGRVLLGPEFAQKMLIVENVGEDKVLITRAKAIPESEAWLYANPEALAALRRGLADAAAGRFVDPPDMDLARKIADEIED